MNSPSAYPVAPLNPPPMPAVMPGILQQAFARLAGVGVTAALLVLVFTVLVSTAEILHASWVRWGVEEWPDYAQLRQPLEISGCDQTTDIEARLQAMREEQEKTQDDLFAEVFDEAKARQSIQSQRALCDALMAKAAADRAQSSPSLRAFIAIDDALAWVAGWALHAPKILLTLLVFCAAVVTSVRGHHVAFRLPETAWDHCFSNALQALANASMAAASFVYLASGSSAGATALAGIASVGFSLLALFHVQRSIAFAARPTLRDLTTAFFAVPLYTWMILIGTVFFIFKEHYLPGLIVHFSSLFDLSNIFLQVGLYLWVGMLLMQTQLAERLLAVLSPLSVKPEAFGVIIVLLLALPTAFTGGSGIIVLALGALVFNELRRHGNDTTFSLATTALSGSAGVVLSPCILIVVIAFMNKEIVSDDLYRHGYVVFAISAAIFAAFALLRRSPSATQASAVASRAELQAQLSQFGFYVLIVAGILLVYAVGLDAPMDEFNSAIILPIVVLGVLVAERRFPRASGFSLHGDKPAHVLPALRQSINLSIEHIGALLFFVAANMVVGGVFQRLPGDVAFDTSFATPLTCMIFMVVILVLLGMFMESMSGVVFISATLASIAYHNGIDPIHFWMTALVAMELGFLTPPVALNQLYVRQVVPQAWRVRHGEIDAGLWRRHEYLLLPIAVMSLTLMIVAFGPFFSGYAGWYP